MPQQVTPGHKGVAVARLYSGPQLTREINTDRPAPAGETRPRINARLPTDTPISTPHKDIATLYDLLNYAANTHGDTPSIGSRNFIGQVDEEKEVPKVIDGQKKMVKKLWSKYNYGPYVYISHNQFRDRALNIGSGLRKAGLNPGDRVTLFAATSVNWLATAHGVLSQSMVMVTAYDTLGTSGLAFSLFQTKAKAVYLDALLIPKLLEALDAERETLTENAEPHVSLVFYNPARAPKQEDLDKFQAAYPRITVTSLDALIESGSVDRVEPFPPKSTDRACIMYTSGSTANPKGVILTHANVVAGVSGADFNVGQYLSRQDSLLAYLPAAHILEFVFENSALFWGTKIGYGNPRTLTDALMVKGCRGDITEFKPTILVGVPAVWEQIRKGVLAQVSGSPIKSNLFWGAFYMKKLLTDIGLSGAAVLDYLIFNKIKAATGGNLRITFNGGSAIHPDTLRFISTSIIPMVSGYGLTETCAMGTIMNPYAWSDNSLGELTGCVQVKLVSYEDAGYLVTNDPPQGEIYIKGASVAEGYLDNPKETEAAFDKDNWFRTGDIGEFDKYGCLKIIDRKKNLVKTLNGEYIALEHLESVYMTAGGVAKICVDGRSDKSVPIAIVVPRPESIKKFASENNIDLAKVPESDVANDERFRSALYKDLVAVGRKNKLPTHAILGAIVVDVDEWTADNECLTAAQKLNRPKIKKRNQEQVDAAYASIA